MDTRKLLAKKREDILRIAVRHGAFNVRLFGSVARGEARPDSDIDLLVDVGSRPSSFFPGGLVADLEELLGRHVDVVEPEGLYWYVRDQILNEAVPLSKMIGFTSSTCVNMENGRTS